MLGVQKYSIEYLNECRKKINSDVSRYRKISNIIKDQSKESNSDLLNFEHSFFNNMILILDSLFVHRLRRIEGREGNPLNEVRVIANSIAGNQGRMMKDSTIRLKPQNSLLKYNVGDKIKVSESQFSLISKAFFSEIERKYTR
jgi:hypothetical protein